MTHSRRLALLFAVAGIAACNGDTTVKSYNTEPQALIASPSDRAQFEEGETVSFTGQVFDEQDDPSSLAVSWVSDLDADFLETSTPDGEGNVQMATSQLSPGNHTITLRVADSDGMTGEAYVAVTIADLAEAPVVSWVHPVSGEYGVEGDTFTFEVQAEDAQDDPSVLGVVLSSDVDGDFCTVTLDATGVGSCDASLSVGDHHLTATVTDTGGNSSTDAAFFTVVADAETDNDGDGWTESQGDCDDADPSVNPGAEEAANGLDDDCDGDVDEGTYSYDDDGDCACEAPTCTGSIDEECVSLDGYDCDDGDDGVYRGAPETCDGVDNDCDLTVDEGTSCYDDDGDGYTESDNDCNDASSAVHPGAAESANGVDDDCDGLVDEGTSAYDDDGDCACESGTCSGSVNASCGGLVSGDCDDANTSRSPTADETCNGVDDDCDGSVDESSATDASTWYRDADSDGYGDPSSSTLGCSAPAGYVANASDCDDSRSSVRPGGTEACNGLDDDCDGDTDEAGATGETVYYSDVDADGFGDPAVTASSCSMPAGYVSDDTDCDDRDDTVHPGADEYCNAVDDDCDGAIDESGALDASVWYRDADADGYGSTSGTAVACTAPSGYAGSATDCNDANGGVHPGATEVCDGVDQDCDGAIDDGALTTWYRDNDADGYGDPTVSTSACSAPSGYVSNASDCNDADATRNPTTVWYRDADGDGYGVSSTTVVQCAQPSGYVSTATDCNDAAAAAHPGGTESCDSLDNDCDGTTDEANATGCTTYYYDNDGDGYGSTSSSCLCATSGKYTATTNTDCYDSNSSAHPTATTYYTTSRGDSSYDYNCDGTETHRYTASGRCDDVQTCVFGVCVTTSCDGATGWNSSDPGCGRSGTYVNSCTYTYASSSGVFYCDKATSAVTQSCR